MCGLYSVNTNMGDNVKIYITNISLVRVKRCPMKTHTR